MKRPRRNHAPAFKARVALAALKGDKTLAELARGATPEYAMDMIDKYIAAVQNAQAALAEAQLSDAEKRHAAALMRTSRTTKGTCAGLPRRNSRLPLKMLTA